MTYLPTYGTINGQLEPVWPYSYVPPHGDESAGTIWLADRWATVDDFLQVDSAMRSRAIEYAAHAYLYHRTFENFLEWFTRGTRQPAAHGNDAWDAKMLAEDRVRERST